MASKPEDWTVTLPVELVAAIDRHIDAKHPAGSIASLNMVAFIGERVAAIRAHQRKASK